LFRGKIVLDWCANLLVSVLVVWLDSSWYVVMWRVELDHSKKSCLFHRGLGMGIGFFFFVAGEDASGTGDGGGRLFLSRIVRDVVFRWTDLQLFLVLLRLGGFLGPIDFRLFFRLCLCLGGHPVETDAGGMLREVLQGGDPHAQ